MNKAIGWIDADWPAPATVKAGCTTRLGGVSLPPYDTLNLGDHVGDDPTLVAQNRQKVIEACSFTQAPAWLSQVHGINVVDAATAECGVTADASYSGESGVACVVMTADCLPVLFCDQQASVVAAAHAGWRGLADGVLEATVTSMNADVGQVMAWLGPAIGPQAFEVGDEVRDLFVSYQSSAVAAFKPSPAGRWLADIYQLARLRLAAMGVTAIYGGSLCTYSDAERFYSYRRDGVTGRMASFVWMA